MTVFVRPPQLTRVLWDRIALSSQPPSHSEQMSLTGLTAPHDVCVYNPNAELSEIPHQNQKELILADLNSEQQVTVQSPS